MSVKVGREAENLAAVWLQQRGFQVLDRNWRTRWCELDIVACRLDRIHIIEVKYRRRPDFGTGFDYITPDKIRRLRRAALMWLQSHQGNARDYQIDVVAASGYPKPKYVKYLPNAVTGY